MFQYVIKRVLIFIPTFFIISLLIFGLSKLAPGDPVELLLQGGADLGSNGSQEGLIKSEEDYLEKAQQLGLDKPAFYFNFTYAASIDTLYRIRKQTHRELIGRLIDQSGASDQVMAYYKNLRKVEKSVLGIDKKPARQAQKDLGAVISGMYDFMETDSLHQIHLKSIREHLAYLNDSVAYALRTNMNSSVSGSDGAFTKYKDKELWYFLDTTVRIHIIEKSIAKERKAKAAILAKLDSNFRTHSGDSALTLAVAKARNTLEELARSSSYETCQREWTTLIASYKTIAEHKNETALYIPSLKFYGLDNQYHNWITHFLTGDFGTSYHDNQPVANKMWDALQWTLIMNFFAILVSYLISIPLGVRGAVWKKDNQKYFPFIKWTTLSVALIIILSISLELGSRTTGLICLFVTFFYGLQITIDKENADDTDHTGAFRKLGGFLGGSAIIIAMLVYIGIMFKLAFIDFVFGNELIVSAPVFTLFIVAMRLGLHLGDKKLTLSRTSTLNKMYLFAKGLCSLVLVNGLIYTLWTLYALAFPKGLAVLLLIATLIGTLIGLVRIVKAERLTKILTDVGSFLISVCVLWTWVMVPWLIMGFVKLVMAYPIAVGFVMALVGLIVLIRKIRMGRQVPKQAGSSSQLTFKIDASGIRVKGYFVDNISTVVLFILYSLPSFWIGTIFIVFLTSDYYGLDFFPIGVGLERLADDATWSTRLIQTGYELVLPIFCITYGSFAFLSRQMRGSMLEVIRQDYIRTAKAKGLSQDKITWKHSFRNSLFPIITVFSYIFPRALSGSIAIELIYNIPGMGKLALFSITARDWPVVFTITMFAALLTMIGNLIADILYAVVDPRVSYQ